MKSAGGFDRIAPVYDFLAKLVFGNKLRDAQNYFLGHLGVPTGILVFGGGSGNLLKTLLKQYPEAKIKYLEASSKMIEIASSRKVTGIENIQFIHGTEQELVGTPDRFDVLITPYVLDVFEAGELERVMDILFEVLEPGGFWVQTDFYVFSDHPWWQRRLVWLMYLFFKIAANQRNQQLPDFTVYFSRLALEPLAEKSFCGKMVKTIWYRKLQVTEPSH